VTRDHATRQMTDRGRSIEDSSFAVIDAEAGSHEFTAAEWQVVRRVIHATADFEFKTLMRFGAGAVAAGVAALRAGCPLIVDVKMISAGLNEARLGAYGCEVSCHISDEDVIADARARDSTRAIEAMRKARRLGRLDGAVVAIGNAPTALFRLLEMVAAGAPRPAAVLGIPVGFIGAAESKEALAASDLEHLIVRGRRGGSAITAAAVNALASEAE
jgi:precorrin-8X/cobalt-precorrin-8 methylmutase